MPATGPRALRSDRRRLRCTERLLLRGLDGADGLPHRRRRIADHQRDHRPVARQQRPGDQALGAACQAYRSGVDVPAHADAGPARSPADAVYRRWQVASGLGLVTLALACLGLYGLVSFTVVQRTRDIGVRIALGASRRGVLVEVLSGAGRRMAPGAASGFPCARRCWRCSSRRSACSRLRSRRLRAGAATPSPPAWSPRWCPREARPASIRPSRCGATGLPSAPFLHPLAALTITDAVLRTPARPAPQTPKSQNTTNRNYVIDAIDGSARLLTMRDERGSR